MRRGSLRLASGLPGVASVPTEATESQTFHATLDGCSSRINSGSHPAAATPSVAPAQSRSGIASSTIWVARYLPPDLATQARRDQSCHGGVVHHYERVGDSRDPKYGARRAATGTATPPRRIDPVRPMFTAIEGDLPHKRVPAVVCGHSVPRRRPLGKLGCPVIGVAAGAPFVSSHAPTAASP